MPHLVDLGVDECLARLRTRPVGRIGFTTPEGQRILPVNYTVVGDALVFRTLPYGAIADHVNGADVAFEVDELDDTMQSGWSVLAVGRCQRVEDPDEVRAIRAGGNPVPWADGQRNLYFKVVWSELSGRQVGTAPGAAVMPSSRAPEELPAGTPTGSPSA